jgi:hypothetical protein
MKSEKYGQREVEREFDYEPCYKMSVEYNNSIQFNSFIYVLDNSQIWPITAKHKNNSTEY